MIKKIKTLKTDWLLRNKGLIVPFLLKLIFIIVELIIGKKSKRLACS